MDKFIVGQKVEITSGSYKRYKKGVGEVIRSTGRKVTVRVESVEPNVATLRVGDTCGYRQNRWTDRLIGEEWGVDISSCDTIRPIPGGA